MSLLVGVFDDPEHAVGALEVLRAARVNTDHVRLIGGPDDTGDLATAASPGIAIAAGPAEPVVEALLEKDVPDAQRRSLEQRVAHGAVLLMAQEVDDATAGSIGPALREHGAADVITRAQPTA